LYGSNRQFQGKVNVQDDYLLAKALQEEIDAANTDALLQNLGYEESGNRSGNKGQNRSGPLGSRSGNGSGANSGRLNARNPVQSQAYSRASRSPPASNRPRLDSRGVNEYEELLELEEDLGKVEIGLTPQQISSLPYTYCNKSSPSTFKRYHFQLTKLRHLF